SARPRRPRRHRSQSSRSLAGVRGARGGEAFRRGKKGGEGGVVDVTLRSERGGGGKKRVSGEISRGPGGIHPPNGAGHLPTPGPKSQSSGSRGRRLRQHR